MGPGLPITMHRLSGAARRHRVTVDFTDVFRLDRIIIAVGVLWGAAVVQADPTESEERPEQVVNPQREDLAPGAVGFDAERAAEVPGTWGDPLRALAPVHPVGRCGTPGRRT